MRLKEKATMVTAGPLNCNRKRNTVMVTEQKNNRKAPDA